MKLSLRFGLLTVLVWLIHCATYEAMNRMDKLTSPLSQPEMCRVSPSNPVQEAMQRLTFFFSIQAGSFSNAEPANAPTDKHMLPPATCFCEHHKPQTSPESTSLHTPSYYHDPISYYIYGLRKIVV
ncbi:hypothetical protein [uncultured Bacteroides sp.]|uniref:hypothetical protein n=1 Tax=uncultured Bacteroides sp. TaxID=162156 RepID=UPI0025E1DD1D|nr:hypothetical protein [uncultured Bacteroides sp.]